VPVSNGTHVLNVLKQDYMYMNCRSSWLNTMFKLIGAVLLHAKNLLHAWRRGNATPVQLQTFYEQAIVCIYRCAMTLCKERVTMSDEAKRQ
jgi:hypothetical protein